MLSATGLSCVRGERQLFAALDLTVAAGEWLHVQGENGAGKTSLLRILAGLSPAAAGEVYWRGEATRTLAEAYRREMLFLGHHAAVKDELTPLENLSLACQLDAVSLDEAGALKALVDLGLRGREDLPVRFLSAGQKRRVLLARLAVRQAALWILDEPFTALDVRAIEMLTQLISAHLARGGMVVLTSHQSLSLPKGKAVLL